MRTEARDTEHLRQTVAGSMSPSQAKPNQETIFLPRRKCAGARKYGGRRNVKSAASK